MCVARLPPGVSQAAQLQRERAAGSRGGAGAGLRQEGAAGAVGELLRGLGDGDGVAVCRGVGLVGVVVDKVDAHLLYT